MLTVGELNQAVARALERGFPLVAVRGEVSNFTRAGSGHCYFTLKDDRAQVRCAMFRLRVQHLDFAPREGDEVEISAQVRLYEARGDYQLVVDAMRRAGAGALVQAFNRLKALLAAEGLFDPERRRPLPSFVRRVGIVSSLDAAALRDVASVLAVRTPHIAAIVYPTPVQGDGAARRIVAAIELANARAEVDLLIVCRGGGSVEDLWAFNEEIVARAIATSRLVVVSGVGHETDVTIADFVADLRAATPTDAAQRIARARDEYLGELRAVAVRLARAQGAMLERARYRLDNAAARLLPPQRRLEATAARLAALGERLAAHGRRRLAQAESRFALADAARRHARPRLADLERDVARLDTRLALAAQGRVERAARSLARLEGVLDAVSPQATLRRGYAIVERDGRIVPRGAGLDAGTPITVRMADVALDARVERTRQQ